MCYTGQIDDNDEQIDMALNEFTLEEMDEMFIIAKLFKDKIMNDNPNFE